MGLKAAGIESGLPAIGLVVFAVCWNTLQGAGAPVPGAGREKGRGMGPRVAFATREYDFGKVKAGQTVRYDFELTNRGSELLKIIEVRPGCGCTTAGQWTRSIEPGKRGTIPIRLSTARFNGRLRKTVRVRTNDPLHPTMMLALTGEVWVPVVVSPRYVAFAGIQSRKDRLERHVRIAGQEDHPLEIRSIASDNPHYRVDLRTVESGREYVLTVSTVPPLEQGLNHGTITVLTTSSDAPKLLIPISAYVRPLVQVIPRRLLLPKGRLGTELVKRVLVLGRPNDPLEVSGPAINAEQVKIDLRRLPASNRVELRIRFPAGFAVPEGPPGLRLTFKTNHPEARSFSIPVVASFPIGRLRR